jgi:hypothetical protein
MRCCRMAMDQLKPSPVFLVDRTYICRLSFNLQQVSRTPVSPPQLSRDAPILHVLHPSDPVVCRDAGLDFELAGLSTLLGQDPFPEH